MTVSPIPPEGEQTLDEAPPKRPAMRQKSNGKRKGFIAAVLIVVALAAVVVVVLAVMGMTSRPLEEAFVACDGSKAVTAVLDSEDSDAETDELEEDTDDVFAEYLEGALALEDDGKTLLVSTLPADDDPLGVSSLALKCVEENLDMPERVAKSIATTRALDGRQEAAWDGYTAEWSYHPRSGLSLIIVDDR